MSRALTFRRVLIVADESADWIVAGLRQLERLALSIDEFAAENKETAPVLVCIFWRPDLDPLQRWIPKNERITRIDFTTELDGSSYNLVLNTRLFLYRHAVRNLMQVSTLTSDVIPSFGEMELWENQFHRVQSLPPFQKGAWEYISNGDEIDGIERRFLRETGKSQDGPVSRFLNRPVSRALTRLLLRFPTTPNGWTLLIFPIPVVATFVLSRGSYGGFLWGLVLFHLFSVFDGCDGEIARAKFLESEQGRRLDDLFDVLSNILLVIGLGFGLSAQAKLGGNSGWFYLIEGIAAALVIGANEFSLARKETPILATTSETFAGTLYPRHRELVERSGLLFFGEKFAYWVMQLTKRDVAILFFLLLAAIGWPELILHLQFGVTVISFVFALRSRGTPNRGAAL